MPARTLLKPGELVLPRRRAAPTPWPNLRSRGFTLIELMVVVVIIGVMAAVAVPTIVERLRERRASEAAQRIAALYRGARMRALGRGAAVLVRYTAGEFRVLEAIRGGDGVASGCENLPESSCLAEGWETASQRLQVTLFNPLERGEYSGVQISAKDVANAATTALDVCYTPLGRAYVRGAPGDLFAPMNGVVSFAVNRGTATLTRNVSVLPNGIARLAL